MTKASQLRDMSVADLEYSVGNIKKELFGLVNEMKRTKKLEKPHLLRQKRKEKARLLTIIHEKQSANQ